MPKATTRAAKRPPFSWDDVSRQDQLAVLEIFGDDGHSIYNADGLRADKVVAASVLDEFTVVEKSTSSYKGSIFSVETGERVAEMRGIYGLTVIRSLAHHYGVTSNKFGRGSEARELTDKLRAILEKEAGA
jgi:hypothetical protein